MAINSDFTTLLKTFDPEKQIITENLKIVNKFSLPGAFSWVSPPNVTRVLQRLSTQLDRLLPIDGREVELFKDKLEKYVKVNAPQDEVAQQTLKHTFEKMDKIMKRHATVRDPFKGILKSNHRTESPTVKPQVQTILQEEDEMQSSSPKIKRSLSFINEEEIDRAQEIEAKPATKPTIFIKSRHEIQAMGPRGAVGTKVNDLLQIIQSFDPENHILVTNEDFILAFRNKNQISKVEEKEDMRGFRRLNMGELERQALFAYPIDAPINIFVALESLIAPEVLEHLSSDQIAMLRSKLEDYFTRAGEKKFIRGLDSLFDAALKQIPGSQ